MDTAKLKAAVDRLVSERNKEALTPVGPDGSVPPPVDPAMGGAAPGAMAGAAAGGMPGPVPGAMPGAMPGGMPMDPAMMDPSMMDPAMMGGEVPPEQDPILMLQEILKIQKQNRQLIAAIVEALQIRPDLGQVLEAGEDPVAEIQKQAAVASIPQELAEAGYVPAETAGSAEAIPSTETTPVVSKKEAFDVVGSDHTSAALSIASKMFGGAA